MSGNLGLIAVKELISISSIDFIATDKNSEEILLFANQNSIPIFVGNPRKGNLLNFSKQYLAKILFSVNYLYLLENELIKQFEIAINFHGSLLPKYRGRTPHVWAIINNEIETGVTAHKIDEGCDTGDIILQNRIEIGYNETGFSILQKFNEVYPIMIRNVLELIELKKIKTIKQDNTKSTFFGKRTPDDGEINWDWQKERIRNWVRALASPYPGAFTYLFNQKIIIDKVEFSDIGYNFSQKNGSVLAVHPDVIVKTSNGAIKLTLFRNEIDRVNISENIILGKCI